MTAPIPVIDGASWALFLDIDGTLLDLAPAPELVSVPAGLAALLTRLSDRFGGALALVSGRTLDSIDRLFPSGYDAVGCHGVQWRLAGHQSNDGRPVPVPVTTRLTTLVAQRPGLALEHKGVALAVHYRGAPELADELRATAAAAIIGASPPLRLQDGKAVVEIVPAGFTKGRAIKDFMRRHPYLGRRPIFVGDDSTDESGFAAVNDLGGVSIHVGDSADTLAGFRVSSPTALRRWLATQDKEGQV
ncbi:MAG: trehalose-phosphatase [Alphaproteobacteria bacterium]|nr:trehalose-phosphatase [Alphaproteobacteria bacterium]